MSACVRRLGCAVLGAESRARFAVTPVRTVCLQQCSHRPVATDCESSRVVPLTHARPRYCGVSSGGLVGRVRHASTEAQDPAGAAWIPKPDAAERKRLYLARRASATLEELSRTGALKVPILDPHALDYDAWTEYGEHKRIRNMASHYCLYQDVFGQSESWLPSARIVAAYPDHPVHRGNVIPVTAAAEAPTVRFDVVDQGETPQRWTLALVTPDGRSEESTATTVRIHWLVEDLPTGSVVDGHTLASVPYTPIDPDTDAGAYRYSFCLLAQDGKTKGHSAPESSVDFPTFLKERGLIPVGVSFFQGHAE